MGERDGITYSKGLQGGIERSVAAAGKQPLNMERQL